MACYEVNRICRVMPFIHEIIVCPECSSNLPTNISELETLNDNMLGESFYNNGVIDIQYDHLAGIIGGELYPKRLERKM